MIPRKMVIALACLLCAVSPLHPQQKRHPRPQPKTDPYLVALPADEILFSAEERRLVMHNGWRIASKGSPNAAKIQTIIYYDEARITHKSNGIIQVWLKIDTVKENKRQSYTMEFDEYDCQRKQWRILESSEYTDADHETVEGDKQWRNFIPESVGERAYLVLCENKIDEEELTMTVASNFFRDARQLEKKGDTESAKFWYKAALEYAPGNEKILAGIERTANPPDTRIKK